MNKIYYSWSDLESQTLDLIKQINLSHWKPDYIVGITRGGLLPAKLLSQWFEVPMYSLDVSLRDNTDGIGPESNCWMAEDAFGYVPTEERVTGAVDFEVCSEPEKQKNILVVDDINDSGATLNWIKEDWKTSCLPSDPVWETVFGSNVRFATLVNNFTSDADVNYYSEEISRAEDPDIWIVFPWEDWWRNNEQN